MPSKVKTLLIWLVVIFLVYAIVTDPERAANVVTSIWEFIAGAFAGFGQFFSSITS